MMKTYNLCCALLALLVFACSKSEEVLPEEENKQNVESDYTLLVNNNGILSGNVIIADAETLSIATTDSGFSDVSEPQLTFEADKVLTMYHKKSDCNGEITVHDFKDASTQTFDVFTDLEDCDLTSNAVLKGGNSVYIAYEVEKDDEPDAYFIRAIDLSAVESDITDIEIEFQPVGLAFANNRVFILGYENISREHRLIVLDTETKAEIHTDNLGNNARNIFQGPDGNIIVGYDELHVTIDNRTLALDYTNYDSATAPNFVSSQNLNFDSTGRLYYAVSSGVHSNYSRIPAVYDFNKNSAVLYAFENFLTKAQRNFEFEIENTTFVNYDEANNLILVGYSKSGGGNKGGLLRIKPIPEPAFVGNLDLEGVPFAIYIK